MPTYSIDVLVLKRRNLGEADRLLTLLSAEKGKFTAIAKGIRKPHSRKSSHLELFTHSRVFLATGRSLDILTQAETIESFQEIKIDYDRILAASYVSELVDKMVHEGEPNQELFSLVVSGLGMLALTEQLEVERSSLLLRLLSLFGYAPQFDNCPRCSLPVGSDSGRFVYDVGGILCGACEQHSSSPHSSNLSASAVALLRRLPKLEEQMDVSETVLHEVSQLLDEYISFILQRQLKSAAMSIS